MDAVTTWFGDNWVIVSSAVAALLALATVITAATKTKTDDKILGAIKKVLALVGIGKAK